MSDDTADMINLQSRGALRTLLEGRSDEEIQQFVAMLGIGPLFDMVIPAMIERFNAAQAGNQAAVVQFDVRDQEGTLHSFHIDVTDGVCTGESGAAETPRLTLTFAVPVFLRFLSGLLDPMQAFMSGQLQVSGDMMFAMTFQGWFTLD